MAGIRKSLMDEADVVQKSMLIALATTQANNANRGGKMSKDEWWAMLQDKFEVILTREVKKEYNFIG